MTYQFSIPAAYLTSQQPDSDLVLLPYTLTTDHAASSYGVPVLVANDGTAYGPQDILPNGEKARIALEWSLFGGGFSGDDDSLESAHQMCQQFGTL